MTIRRPMGTETEFGIVEPGNTYANSVKLSTTLVKTYRNRSRAGTPVTWDYSSEDPLHDMRGYRIDRAAADPSQLTDDPNRLAASGPGTQLVMRPSALEVAMPKPTATVLTNGARWYVDHAHPEYSAPETMGPLAAARYDQAGDRIAQRAATLAKQEGTNIALYKNNTDGKGASYGSHENYLVSREVEFKALAEYLIPFFTTRPIFCGAGRVGRGQRGETAGYQISQRADYIENDIGLETTFNRPIVNTRDEPHADSARFRRLHVINGDANNFAYSTYLRIGATSAFLWLIEQGAENRYLQRLATLKFVGDPVAYCRDVSYDLNFQKKFPTVGHGALSALQIQKIYCDTITQAMFADAAERGETLDDETQQFLQNWSTVLVELETNRSQAARKVEWLGKYQLLDGMRQRLRSGWDHPRLLQMDIQWAALDPTQSLSHKLLEAGLTEELFTEDQVLQAVTDPPTDTRAFLRGRAVSCLTQVTSASWTALVVDLQEEDLLRVSLGDPDQTATRSQLRALEAADARGFVDATVENFRKLGKEAE